MRNELRTFNWDINFFDVPKILFSFLWHWVIIKNNNTNIIRVVHKFTRMILFLLTKSPTWIYFILQQKCVFFFWAALKCIESVWKWRGINRIFISRLLPQQMMTVMFSNANERFIEKELQALDTKKCSFHFKLLTSHVQLLPFDCGWHNAHF
jgi:hypothetical protein